MSVKRIPKRVYRNCAIIAAGACVIAVVSLTSTTFGGSGKNAVKTDGHAGTNSIEGAVSDEDLTEVADKTEEIIKNTFDSVVSIADSQRLKIEKLKKERLEKERLEKERLEKERLEAERLEAERLEAERLEAERLEAEKREITLSFTGGLGSITAKDYDALLRIVEAEAGNQDEVGKILVANVIINRVKSERFPDDIYSVITQGSNTGTPQFTPASVGGIFYYITPSEHTKQCVDRALAGEDYSEGALFFCCQSSEYSWFNTQLNLVLIHGPHYFYKY